MNTNTDYVLVNGHDFPIRHVGEVHNGKVRSFYKLSAEDSARLIEERGYDVHPNAQLGIMIITDKISAFDVVWTAEGDLGGVSGKGACLNAQSKYWFDQLKEKTGYDHHLLEQPQDNVWIVQVAEQVMVEAITRDYATGSMWRAHENGEKEFCGYELPEDLTENQKLDERMWTPTTKGIMRGIDGIKEEDDTRITYHQIVENYKAFGFKRVEDVGFFRYATLTAAGFVSDGAEEKGQLRVDGKTEMGYVLGKDGEWKLIFTDEMGSCDGARFWDGEEYKYGRFVQKSKEPFRQGLVKSFPRLVKKPKLTMKEKLFITDEYRVPGHAFDEVTDLYMEFTEDITGIYPAESENPRENIMKVIEELGLLEEVEA